MIDPIFAIFAFLPVSIALFWAARPSIALAIIMLSAELFLPVSPGVNVTLLPPIDRYTIASIGAVLGGFLFGGASQRMPRFSFPEIVLIALLVGAIGTTLTNGDAFFAHGHNYKALDLKDAYTTFTRSLFYYFIPFYMARMYFRSSTDLRILVACTLLAATIYALLIAFESLMSPQLHKIVYGYHPNNFHKSIRLGGYRPTVFMYSGIGVATFMAIATIMAVSAVRAGVTVFSQTAKIIAAWIAFGLLLTRSLAALVYGAVIPPILFMLSPKWSRLAAMLALAVIVSYPFARMVDVFPTDTVVFAAGLLNEERAPSLATRFRNEDQAIGRTAERPIFGWGAYGRMRVLPEMLIRATDGFWLNMYSQKGLVGLLCIFGLFWMPAFLALRRIPMIHNKTTAHLMLGLVWAVIIRAADMLPNGLYGTLPFALAGALYGLAESIPNWAKTANSIASTSRASTPEPQGILPAPQPANAHTLGALLGESSSHRHR